MKGIVLAVRPESAPVDPRAVTGTNNRASPSSLLIPLIRLKKENLPAHPGTTPLILNKTSPASRAALQQIQPDLP
jgi:hypothetical protein